MTPAYSGSFKKSLLVHNWVECRHQDNLTFSCNHGDEFPSSSSLISYMSEEQRRGNGCVPITLCLLFDFAHAYVCCLKKKEKKDL